jgi:hypothetical protein
MMIQLEDDKRSGSQVLVTIDLGKSGRWIVSTEVVGDRLVVEATGFADVDIQIKPTAIEIALLHGS